MPKLLDPTSLLGRIDALASSYIKRSDRLRRLWVELPEGEAYRKIHARRSILNWFIEGLWLINDSPRTDADRERELGNLLTFAHMHLASCHDSLQNPPEYLRERQDLVWSHQAEVRAYELCIRDIEKLLEGE